MDKKELLSSIESDRDYLVALRRTLHMYPELSKEEFNTALLIEKELDKLSISHTRVGLTGIYAEIKGEKEGDKTIVLRADTDALPLEEAHECSYKSRNKGVMHACGHDAHTAALLGAVRYLASHRSSFGGTIRIIFQQAEEIGYGARIFVDEGYLKGADRTFGCHTESRLKCGKVSLTPGANNASVDYFKFTVNGKKAHVSTPERGVDALFIASTIVVAIQAIVSRLTNPTDPLLIGIGKLQSGEAYNIVASSATAEGTIRALSKETRAKAKEEVKRVAENIAMSYGGTVDFIWKDYASPLINDEKATKEAQKVATCLFGEEKVITNRPVSLGGDDFAEFINAVPGVYAFVGSGNENKEGTEEAHHNPHFDVDEDCILIMAELEAAYAISFLNGDVN